MATSPTQNSLRKLRAEGYVAEVVERWVPGANIRKDLFSFGDIVAISPRDEHGVRTMKIVQATSYSNLSARLKKIAECEFAPMVRECGVGIEAHGWRKVKGRWTARVVDLS